MTRKTATEDLVPVAPESAIRRVRLTRVEKRSGEWIYSDEVELGEVAHAPRDLRVDKPEGGTQLKGQLVCREIIAAQGKTVTNHDSAVLCCFPYSMDWYSWSAFKRGTHKKADDVKQRLAADPMPAQVLEECRFDPFDTSGNRLTARFVEYARTEGLRVTTRDRQENSACDLHLSSPKQRFTEGQQYWLYGIVEGDFERIISEILGSGACVDLLEQGQMERILYRGENNIPRLRLRDRQYDLFSSLCAVILDSSVRKALAGLPPDELARLLWKGDEPRRLTVLVEYIFSKSVIALAKRLSGEVVFETDLSPKLVSPEPPPPREPLEELIEVTRAALQRLLSASGKEAPPVTVPILWKVSRTELKKPDPEQALLIAAALYRLGYSVPTDIVALMRAITGRNADAAEALVEILKPRAAQTAGQR